MRQCGACLVWGAVKLGSDRLCEGCRSWQRQHGGKPGSRWGCRGCRRELPVDQDALCRGCAIAARAELRSGREVILPWARQLRLHLSGLGLHEAYSLPRRSRETQEPLLTPRVPRQPDPRFLPGAPPGQLGLFPAPRRRVLGSDRARLAGRAWPEENLVAAHLDTLPPATRENRNTVMAVLRFALAMRDADGDTLVAEEALDQIGLPLKAAAGQLLRQAGLLRPRLAPHPARFPVRGCQDCGNWGITERLCPGCRNWYDPRGGHAAGQCPRCIRDGLPIHRKYRLCRGCLVFVREFGTGTGPGTQLSFAGELALRVTAQDPAIRRPPRKPASPLEQRTVSPHLLDPHQQALFTADRDWSRIQHLTADQLPRLTECAAALVAEFAAAAPPDSPGGKAQLRTLLSWLGGQAPVREYDVRALAAGDKASSTLRVLDFLHLRGLLVPDPAPDPGPGAVLENRSGQLAHPGSAGRTGVAALDTTRTDRNRQQAIDQKLATVPGPMAEHLRAWITVLRGQGRRRRDPVSYHRIRRQLQIVLPVLHTWAGAGLDLRQITGAQIRAELGQRQGSRARDVHHVLRGLFSALKQERLIFCNPMSGLSLTTPVRMPVPLPSDRLRGALDTVEGPRARLVIVLVGIHGLRPVEVTRLLLDELDLTRLVLHLRRGAHRHTVYLDALTADLITAWLTERHRRWPRTRNPHLILTSHTAHHLARPAISYLGLRSAFDKIGILPKQLWSDRILHEAQVTADPIHLVRLFGITPGTAVKYVRAAYPGQALPTT